MFILETMVNRIFLSPFRSSIQLYNFILHLHIDPGDKIYLIDEFRCWKVENLDDERSDENKNEGGANSNGLVFSACKLNLPLVPSQDYVLQDNKKCYDKILSDWNFRPPSNVFW